MSSDICTDNRFELIEKYKKKLIEATNIEDSQKEMEVIDNILFRMWQMKWLDKLEADVVEVVRCKDCKHGNYFVDAHTDNYGTSVKAKVYCRIWQDWVSANGYCFLADKRERREDGSNN